MGGKEIPDDILEKYIMKKRRRDKMDKQKINKGHVVTAVLYAKAKNLKTNYATLDECDFYSQMLMAELDERGISVDYEDKIDLGYFNLNNNVITPNSDISINSLVHKFKVSKDIKVMYDREFQLKFLNSYYSEIKELNDDVKGLK